MSPPPPAAVTVRPTRADDVPALERVLDATQRFPSELLGELIAAHLRGERGEESWLTAADARVLLHRERRPAEA